MATPTWNQITAPNFSAGNDLIAQAMAQLTKATTGFKSIADEYKDTIQKRNLGLIQEYVNSAKTPEELQSEAFQTNLAKLTGNMAGEYDTLAKAQIVDGAKDKLTTRALNSLNLESGQFDLGQKRLRAPTELDLLQTNALNAKQVLATNEVAANVAKQTQNTQVKQALANLANTNSITSSRAEELKLRKEELDIQRENLNGGYKPGGYNDPNRVINETYDAILANAKGAADAAKGKFTWKNISEWEQDKKHGQWTGTPSKPMREIVAIAQSNERFQNFPAANRNAVQAAVVDYATNKMQLENLLGSHDWTVNKSDRERYAKYVEEGLNSYSADLDFAQQQEKAILGVGANKLARTLGIDTGTAMTILGRGVQTAIPTPKTEEAPPTYDERQKMLAEREQLKETSMVTSRANKLGTVGINLKQAANLFYSYIYLLWFK
jgi:hypothetical protein